MKTIEVGGTSPAGALAEHLRSRLPAERIEVLGTGAPSPGRSADLSVLLIDVPLEYLETGVSASADGLDMVLIEWGPGFAEKDELGMEREVKDATGARKVLIYRDERGRGRAFGKVLDVSLSILGGDVMPEEIPPKVIAAAKEAAEDNKVSCARAHRIAEELEVPVTVVGRALDLLQIKITECQLGCF